MKEVISTVTSKGQVTIPAEIRRLLGISRGDKVSWRMTRFGSPVPGASWNAQPGH